MGGVVERLREFEWEYVPIYELLAVAAALAKGELRLVKHAQLKDIDFLWAYDDKKNLLVGIAATGDLALRMVDIVCTPALTERCHWRAYKDEDGTIVIKYEP